MTKRAERPVTIAFISNYRHDDPKFTCTFDSNRFIEWEIQPFDMPIAHVIFRGEPIEDNSYTELARVKFDYCDNGLSIYQDLSEYLYEAQHPWLDYEDAVEKKAFDFTNKTVERIEEQFLHVNEGGGYAITDLCTLKKLNGKNKIDRFKPLKPFDFYRFNQVEIWQPSK
jgi:hypothetical protein